MATHGTSSVRACGPDTADVLIVEDHPTLRHSLRRHLEQVPRFRICAEAETEVGAIQALEVTRPDLILLDLTLVREDGLQVLTALHHREPAVPVLVLSMVAEEILGEPTMAAGASGYLVKADASECLLEAMDSLLAGREYRHRATSPRNV